jgi:hypothetical protein
MLTTLTSTTQFMQSAFSELAYTRIPTFFQGKQSSVDSLVAWWEHGKARIWDTLRSCVLGGDWAVEMGKAAADSERMEFEVKAGLLTRAAHSGCALLEDGVHQLAPGPPSLARVTALTQRR